MTQDTHFTSPSLEQSNSKTWPVLIALCIFAFTYRSNTGAYLVGALGALTYLMLAKLPQAPKLPRSLITVSKLFAAGLSVHLCIILARAEYPLWPTLEGYLHYYEFLLFIPLSLALYHVRQHAIALLFVPVAAVVIRILSHTDFASLDTTLFSPSLFGFGKYHTGYGLQGMQVILTLVCLAYFTINSASTKTTKLVLSCTLLAALLLLLQALMTAGSRGGWAGLLVGLVVLALVQLPRLRLQKLNKKVIAIVVLSAIAVVSLNKNKLEKRLIKDTKVNFEYSLSIEKLPKDRDVFFARRVHLSHFGYELWMERPAVGHGPAAVDYLLEAHPQFNIHPHLHNTYIQIAAELGALGLTIVFLLIGSIAVLLWQRRKVFDGMQRVILIMLVVNSTSLAVWSLPFDHLHWSDWRFTLVWYLSYAALLLRLQHAPSSET